ncbi:MAG: hypothetical protein FJ112_04780 [Deltaproteobacteria bacterium]|nr:hypothetical protein [Deltaproteobacteria bacterium]
MLTPLLVFSRGTAWLGFVCLFLSLGTVEASSNPVNLWEDSQDAFVKNDPQRACSALKTWISMQEAKGINSPQAYFNYGVCSWDLKEHATSVSSLLKSLRLRQSLFKRIFTLNLLVETQREIGIPDNLPSKLFFKLKFLFPKWISLTMASLGFWGIIFYFVCRRNHATVRKVFLVSGCLTLIPAFFLLLLELSGGAIAVVKSTEVASLYQLDKSGKASPLASLPQGTLLELGHNNSDNSEVLKPMRGWIKTEAVNILDR